MNPFFTRDRHHSHSLASYWKSCDWLPAHVWLQATDSKKGKEAVKPPNKKSPVDKSPPKPPKEKPVKPKKEPPPPKTPKPAKPEPTPKSKPAGHQPGVIRGITYYKATRTDESETDSASKGDRGAFVCLCVLSVRWKFIEYTHTLIHVNHSLRYEFLTSHAV